MSDVMMKLCGWYVSAWGFALANGETYAGPIHAAAFIGLVFVHMLALCFSVVVAPRLVRGLRCVGLFLRWLFCPVEFEGCAHAEPRRWYVLYVPADPSWHGPSRQLHYLRYVCSPRRGGCGHMGIEHRDSQEGDWRLTDDGRCVPDYVAWGADLERGGPLQSRTTQRSPYIAAPVGCQERHAGPCRSETETVRVSGCVKGLAGPREETPREFAAELELSRRIELAKESGYVLHLREVGRGCGLWSDSLHLVRWLDVDARWACSCGAEFDDVEFESRGGALAATATRRANA